MKKDTAPLTESIAFAVAKLVDDGKAEAKREPTHHDLDEWAKRFGLSAGDPKTQGQTVGKFKRVRAILYWALDNDQDSGERAVASLIQVVRGRGGFLVSSPNFVGEDTLENAVAAFQAEGQLLGSDGELRTLVLDQLQGKELTDTLQAYTRRAIRGVEDAALLVGTGKDLLEAVAGHVVQERFNTDPSRMHFPGLLGQAFVAVNLATPETDEVPGEPVQKRVDRALYTLGCAINTLRNKQGTGHGRPWPPEVTKEESRIAVESMGIIAQRLLDALRGTTL